jgi:hypothetical protein
MNLISFQKPVFISNLTFHITQMVFQFPVYWLILPMPSELDIPQPGCSSNQTMEENLYSDDGIADPDYNISHTLT